MRPYLSAVAFSAKIELRGHVAGRTEFCGWERHILEDGAGVILLGRYAFLVGNAVLGCVDEILCGTNDANDRENTERYCEVSSLAVNESAIDLRGDRLGNIGTATTATAAAVVSLANFGCENDRIYNLNDRRGHVLRRADRLGDSAIVREIGTALENADVALSTEENYALFKDRDAVEFLTSATAEARLKGDLDVELDGDRIEAAVEFHGINADIGPGDAGILRADACGVLDDVVTEIGEQHLHILEAIAVAAGIEYPIGFDAYRLAFRNILINTARKSVILHR